MENKPTLPPDWTPRPVDGSRILVVGASGGIGAALVRRLVGEGYRVAAIARRAEALADLADSLQEHGEGRVLPFVHDVLDLGKTRPD